MAKTAAERKRASRARMSQEKREEVKKNDRKRRKFKYSQMSHSELKKHQRQSKEGMKKLRAKRKEAAGPSTPTLQTPPRTPRSAFTTRQAFGKARARARRSLPQTPKRRSAVLTSIASEESLSQSSKSCRCDEQRRSGRTQLERRNEMAAAFQDAKEEVTEFFHREDLSRILPGKKDVKMCRDKDGTKRHVQRRVMTMTLKESHKLFSRSSRANVSLASFCRLRPPDVELVGSMKKRVCCCPKCENLSFKLASAPWCQSRQTIQEILGEISCNPDSAAHMVERCDECSKRLDKFFAENLDTDAKDTTISFNVWDGGTLMKKTMSHDSFIANLHSELIQMKQHQYNIRRQAEELRKAKEALLTGGKDIILQTDFAERYSVEHRNEVMQAHWKKAASGVSIYTAVAYYRDDNGALQCVSYGVISESEKQSAYEVVMYNRRILDDLIRDSRLSESIYGLMALLASLKTGTYKWGTHQIL